MQDDIWPTVHAERTALANDLIHLSPEQWSTRSLCRSWSVHDVLIHLVASARETRLRFVAELARARFNFDRLNANQIAAGRDISPQQTLAAFRAVASSTATPPAPRITRLIEVVVHGEDIRRPLQIVHEYPTRLIGPAIEHYFRDRLEGGRARLSGVRMVATDTPISVGVGPPIEGPAISLLLAAAGRQDALADLRGAGVATLAARM